MNTREAYIALNIMQGVGPVCVRALAGVLGSVEAIFEVGRADLMRADGVGPELARAIAERRSRVDPSDEVDRARRTGASIVTPADEGYPDPLREIHDPPLALYVQGGLDGRRDRHAVAVVGSRRTTHYGLDTAGRFGYGLAQAGYTVVSGLARGIDTAAHQGALKAGGRTIAVLGGALDRLYPPENADLARAIADGAGAVLSEFAMGREPDKTTFPIRNRLVSGLSQGVLVVEAGLTSGAMITAREAADQGRQVFAVPGRIDSASSQGSHRLIKDGAALAESVDDVLDALGALVRPERRSATSAASGAGPERTGPMPVLTPAESAVVEALRGEERMDLDTLTRAAGLGAADAAAAVVGLELKRVVRMRPGRVLELVR